MVDFAAHTANIISRLGQPVGITPNGQPERQVVGVFTREPAVAFGLVDGFTPTLRLTVADAAGLIPGDPVTIGAANYIATRVREDAEAGDVVIEVDAT